MKVHVLGPGCAKCRKLAENAQSAVKELGLEVQVVKVTNIDEIVKSGVMLTPGLAVDGKVMSAGRIAAVDEIKRWIIEAGDNDDARG